MGAALLVLFAAVVLGAANLAAWMRGQRRWPLIAAHFAFGVGGVALLAFALRESLAAGDYPVRTAGRVALALLAVAVVTGLAAPRLRGGANSALTVHLSCAVIGFFIALALRGQI